MPEVSVEVEVYCATCGAGLCNETESTTTRSRSVPCFRVSACSVCLERATDNGFDRGYENGYENGYEKGDSEGYERGWKEARQAQEERR
ncbi:MAG: hypothetical protein KGL39_18660 [Patescibacteria group bacterium]|nr:hypothetical protein [Patescibacteria group bacterium]